MPLVQLTKSDFLDYLKCSKSLWLHKHKPDAIAWPQPTLFEQQLMRDGMAVENLARSYIQSKPDAGRFSFQVEFATNEGLYARADIVRQNEDGSLDIWEVKSSSDVKSSSGDHRVDAAFQTLVAESAGETVRTIGIVHVNKEYVREGDIDPEQLLVFNEVTEHVRDLLNEVTVQAEEALALLQQPEIEEDGCDCLTKSAGKHCASFAYFNPAVPSPSIYDLPSISGARLEGFVADGRFSVADILPNEVTVGQKPVLQALKSGQPVINADAIRAFVEALQFPLYFYDYETFASPLPLADGHLPNEQMPVQVSLHRLDAPGAELIHRECLTEAPGAQSKIVEFLVSEIGEQGNLISWNASFENGCNKRLARLFPEQEVFLLSLEARTSDLMILFKKDYVHPDFMGSYSIKKVLPVLAPDLEYDQDAVHDGSGAIEAWGKLISTSDPHEKQLLRDQLLAYCKLDTLAMVRIYQALIQTIEAGAA